MKTYYLVVDGDECGPYTIDEMIRRGLGQKTPIFDEETNCWVRAETVPEIVAAFVVSHK